MKKILPATSKGFKKAFPEKKNEIEKIIKEKKFDFSNEKDLILLLKKGSCVIFERKGVK